MKNRFVSRLLAAVALAFLACAQSAFAAAPLQAQPPSIVGTYQMAGVYSISNCSVVEINYSTPIFGDFVVTSQDGSQFSGGAFSDGQGNYFISFEGTVGSDGALRGTWSYVSDTEGYSNQILTGSVSGQNISVDLSAIISSGDASCSIDFSLSSGAILLSWTAPDPAAGALAPPRDLTATNLPDTHPTLSSVIPSLAEMEGRAKAAAAEPAPPGAVTAYKVYRATQPNVQPDPANIFATVPPNQTTIPAAAGLHGSYFVVTACYDAGMSPPSNEVSASATPGPSITSLSITAKKLVANGSGFSASTTVTIDGVAFVTAPKIKKAGARLIQKGLLADGRSLAAVLHPGDNVQVSFHNPDGGITNLVITVN